jgi:hypothetical protein
MTSLRLKSRVARLERPACLKNSQHFPLGGTAADQRLLRRIQAALKRMAEHRGNEARPKREEAA